MCEDTGGRPIAFLRSEVFGADLVELGSHELKHAGVQRAAMVTNGASDSSEVVSVGIYFALGLLGAVVKILDQPMCARAVKE